MTTKNEAMSAARRDACWGVIGGEVKYTDDGTAVVAQYPPIAPGVLSGGDWYSGRDEMTVRYPYREIAQ